MELELFQNFWRSRENISNDQSAANLSQSIQAKESKILIFRINRNEFFL